MVKILPVLLLLGAFLPAMSGCPCCGLNRARALSPSIEPAAPLADVPAIRVPTPAAPAETPREGCCHAP